MRKLVFMVDVDNTVLDNDGVKQDMERAMLQRLGAALATRFWELYEEVRKDTDVVDFVETMRRLDEEHPESHELIAGATEVLMNWDFRPRLYPDAS